MELLLPPELPPIRILIKFKSAAASLSILAISLVLSACASVQEFNFRDRVTIREAYIPASKELDQWKLYSTTIYATNSGCSSYTNYHSQSTVVGQTVYTYTNPIDGTACFKGDDLSKEEEQDYQLLRAGLMAKENGATTFFKLRDKFWMPLSDSSYDQLLEVFQPEEGDDRIDVQVKGAAVILNQIPYNERQFKTSSRYFFHTKLEKVFDESEFNFLERYEGESEYDHQKRLETWSNHLKYLMMMVDPENKGVDALVKDGVLIPKFHAQEGYEPVFPEPYQTSQVISRISKKYGIHY